MAAGPGKPSGGPRGGTIAPTVPYGPSVQPVTRRRGSRATTYDESEREEAEKRRSQSEPSRSGQPSDAAERARARAEVQRALKPPAVRLRDAVATAVFGVLTDYQQYFREVQNRALVANTISERVGDTLREIEDTGNRRSSIKRTIETSIDWMTAAVNQTDIPTIKAAILAAIEETVII